MNPLVLAQSEVPQLPIAETAAVVLIVGLLATIGWLLYFYR